MKKLNQIIKSTKEYIIKALADTGVHVQLIIKSQDFPMWDIFSTYSVKLYEERLAEQSAQ